MIKSIIFDCFGVLTSDGWLPFAQKHFGNDPIAKQQAHDLSRQVDSGLLDYDGFVAQVADLAHVEVTQAYKDIENNIANHRLFDYVAQLKKTYKIGLLSNAGADWLDELFTAEQVALFDATALSFEMGITKPYPQAYHTICDRLGVQPNEAVFIDDIERYATGAKDIGMYAIWYKNYDQLKQELEQLLANSNS